jgi:hypothetical protein
MMWVFTPFLPLLNQLTDRELQSNYLNHLRYRSLISAPSAPLRLKNIENHF